MGNVGKRARRYTRDVRRRTERSAPIDAVIFDLYETLVTEFNPDWRPSPSTAERLGVDQDAFDAAWRDAWPRRYVGGYDGFPSVLRDLCRRVGERADEAVVQQLYQERLVAKRRPLMRTEDAVIDMLRHLQDVGLKLGLISNCDQEEVAAWLDCPLSDFIADPVFSCDVGLAKPDTAIYRLACERLGVAPERAAYVGDGGHDELSGAAEAGLTPYWASWFIDRWPEWRRNETVYQHAVSYPRLREVGEAMGVMG